VVGPLAFGAFLVGLLGGVHCIGMCGGIAASLAQPRGSRMSGWAAALAYSMGRIGSYAAAGGVIGAVGGATLLLDRLLPVQIAMYVIANVLLVSLGLYLAGWAGWVARLEGLGRGLWAKLQPAVRPLLPADSVPRALLLGALWGWLPCGLVYSLLATALLTGSPAGGAAVMAAFGLGTLPNLLAAGVLFDRVRVLSHRQALRLVAGGLVTGFGVVGLVRAADLADHIRRGLLCL
jgi:sulfite exporter TauE/SafE